jgi:hypothetical protein
LLCVDIVYAEQHTRQTYGRPVPQRATNRYPAGRRGWITVRHDDGVVPDDDLEELVDISYTAVVAKLPKRLRPET